MCISILFMTVSKYLSQEVDVSNYPLRRDHFKFKVFNAKSMEVVLLNVRYV